ncbi:hypothetical protein ABVK25_009467 [Lepraria finkii]|uniref:Uncharacterized protein n=1 Tax=Lepraria finkii TaxID=1340010 RepID=A0ABR4AX59_9LECA
MNHPRSQTCPYVTKSIEQRSIDAYVPSFRSVADSQHKEDTRPPRKYHRGDEVYDKNDKRKNGVERRTRRWVCCYRWKKKKEGRKEGWYYKLKDAPFPHGKDVAEVSERNLKKWQEMQYQYNEQEQK